MIPAAVFGGAPVFAPSRKLVATTNGLIVQGSQLGQVIGPPLLAWTVSASGTWQAAPWILTVAAACGIILAVLLGALERKVGE
jgi:MFS family permease